MKEAKKSCTDQMIIHWISSLEASKGNLAVRCIQNLYGKIISGTLKRKMRLAQPAERQDLITDAILAFFNAIRENRFELREGHSVKAYLLRTLSNLINMHYRKSYQTQPKEVNDMDEIDRFIMGKMPPQELGEFVEKMGNDSLLQEKIAYRRQFIIRRKREEELPDNLPEEPKVNIDLDLLEKMKSLIGELPPIQQQLLTAHYQQGISLKTFAELKNLTPESVRQQHHRSLKRLRDLFKR